MKYNNLKPTIESFFSDLSGESAVKPFPSIAFSPFSTKHGPDIMRLTMVAEIKDKDELARDLPSSYWSNWNSEKTSFGGKKKEYKLKDDLPSQIPADGQVKGWIAIIFGQLKHYSVAANLLDGWLIVEGYDDHKQKLIEALYFLIGADKIRGFILDSRNGIGFVHIYFKITA